MAIHLKWHKKPHVIAIELRGNITIEAIQHGYKDYTELLRDIPEPIIVLLDVRGMGTFPVQLSLYEDILRLMRDSFANNTTIIIGAAPIASNLITTITQYLGIESWTVNTPEEADLILRRLLKSHFQE